MSNIHLTRGHNLKISGVPKPEIVDIPCPKEIKLIPDNFPGVKPKLLVKVGDDVKIGSKVYFDKKNTSVFFTSPVSGIINDIKLGERRKIEEITISCDNKDTNYKKPEQIVSDINREDIKSIMLESGLWPMLRQRPFSKIAKPDSMPKSIFVSAMPNAPFSLDLNVALEGMNDSIDAGIRALGKLTDGDVNLVLDTNKQYSIFNQNIGCKIHYFSGPYPSGNTGVHIHHIDPISSKNDIVWYISLQDLAYLGKFFLDGSYPVEKVVSVGGSCLSNPQYYRVKNGTSISQILEDQNVNPNHMIISGDVLTGTLTDMQSPLSFYHEVLSIIPHSKERDFFGWILPGLNKYSVSRAFISALFDKKTTNMDTRINGSRRAIIPFGRWESMLPMDLYPDFIIKSILANDIEDMEKYGIYECHPDDFAMCTFACQSKVEVSKIIQDGLNFMEEEG